MGVGRIKINRALLKYGYENFHIEVFVHLFDKESLDKAEEGFIEMYNSIENGYNCKTGGFSGKHDDATKEIMRQKKLGHKASEETKRKMSEAHSGKVYSEEQRQNITSGKTNHHRWIILAPDGIIHEVKNLSALAREYGVSHSVILREYAGWKIILKHTPKKPKETIDVKNEVV
jgi:group I intron endonuclease